MLGEQTATTWRERKKNHCKYNKLKFRFYLWHFHFIPIRADTFQLFLLGIQDAIACDMNHIDLQRSCILRVGGIAIYILSYRYLYINTQSFSHSSYCILCEMKTKEIESLLCVQTYFRSRLLFYDKLRKYFKYIYWSDVP